VLGSGVYDSGKEGRHWVHSLGSLADEARLANSILKQRGELRERKKN
jgi:hypothetical protein